jgi:hypothetical protein
MHSIANAFRVTTVCFGEFVGGNKRERGHLGDQGVDGRVILRLISKECDVEVLTGLIWLRIGTVDRNL